MPRLISETRSVGTKHFVNDVAHLFGLDALHNVVAHLVFLAGEDMNDVPLIFALRVSVGHKSVQPGEEVHNVDQDEIEERDVAAEQQHRDDHHERRIDQFLVSA